MIIFLYGADTYRSKEKLSALKQKFKSLKDGQGINIASLDAGDINVDILRKTVLSGGLFSQKRLTIITGLLQAFPLRKKEQFDNLCKEALTIIKNLKDNILIFFDEEIKQKDLTAAQKQLYNALEKTKYAQEFTRLGSSQAREWIEKYIEKNNMNVEAQAINLLVNIYGNNLWSLKNELDKIIAARKHASIVRAKDVQTLALSKAEQDIWKLIDAIGQKKKSLAIKLLSYQIKNGVSIDYLIAMLSHQYRTIIRIKSYIQKNGAANSYAMARALSLHPFVCKNGLDQEKNYTLEELKKIYHQLLKIDFLRKTKRINSEALLDILIIK